MLSSVQNVAAIAAGALFFLAGLIVIPSGLLMLGIYLMVAGFVCAGSCIAWRHKEKALRQR